MCIRDSNQTVYDPWHYVPVLARKPGALRNGAPFQGWELPSAMERVRRRLKAADDGDRQMVSIASRGGLQPITQYAPTACIAWSAYFPKIWDAWQNNGDLWGIMITSNSYAVSYTQLDVYQKQPWAATSLQGGRVR